MRFAILSLACLILSLWSGACSDSDPVSTGTVSTDVIVPLQVGNEWRYQLVTGGTGSDTDRVVGTTTIASAPWYVYQLDSTQFLWVNNRSDGLWVKSPLGPEYLFLKYPALAGDSYTVLDADVTVAAVLDTVDVFAGRFLCNRYEFVRGGRLDVVVYAAPAIGVVRWEDWTQGSPNQIETAQDLVDYVLFDPNRTARH